MKNTIRKEIDELYDRVSASEGEPPTKFEVQIAFLEALGIINETLGHLVTAVEDLDQGFRARK